MKIDLSDTRFLEILTECKLDKYFSVLALHNTANSAGYHNFNHIKTVVIYCYEMVLFTYFENSDRRALLLAALFHDFNHSQGKFDDTYNVSIAIDNMKKWCLGIESAYTIDLATELMRATEVPHVIPDDKLTELQKVIQDADCLQMCSDDFIQTTLIGYCQQEFGSLDFKKNLEGELKFLPTLKYHTKTAQKIASIKMPEKIELINRMLTLIGD